MNGNKVLNKTYKEREKGEMKKIKYKGLKLIIKEVPYQFEYYCTKLNGYVILYINEALPKVHKSNILHKIIKTRV